jgi:membrane protein implicated in regulation of membrane protease activity
MDPAALFFAHPFWSWIAIGGIFLIGELLTSSGWLLWPAGAAAVVAVTTRFVALGGPGELVLFVVVSIVATYLGRRFLRPAGRRGEHDVNDPAQRLVGQQAETTAPFHAGLGRVFVDGKEWAAELDGGGELAAKAKVEVVEIVGGARLKVRPA